MTEAQFYMLIGVLFYIAGAIYQNRKLACITMSVIGAVFFILSGFVK